MTSISLPRRAVTSILLLMLLAVAAGTGLLVWQQASAVRDDRRADAARAAVVKVAEAQVLDLTTLDAASLDTHLKRLADRSTGQFKTQLASLSSVFTSIVGKQDVESKGTITGSGIVSITPAKAQVLIAASAAVTQKGTAKPRAQRYRMSVDLIRAGDTWLISGMEFVP